ncbi:MAG: hypothetical protein NVSMB65_11890 [Chloroflexota bacterium]
MVRRRRMREVMQTTVALALGLGLFLGVAPGGSAHAPVIKTHTTTHPQVIVAVGDSITYGLHDTRRSGGWVGRLTDSLAEDYPGTSFAIINAGVNGDTAAGVLKRLDHDVLAARPNLVIISIGTNDFDYGVPPDSFRYTLTRILKRVQAASVPVLLVSMLPIADLPPHRLVAESAYNAIIAQVAALFGAGYLDEFDRWLALGSAELKRLRDDPEHPKPIGYSLLAGTMAAFLETQYLTPDGQILPPSNRPASDLLPDATLEVPAAWQNVAIHTRPRTMVSVTVTSTNGQTTTSTGQSDRSGSYVVQNH